MWKILYEINTPKDRGELEAHKRSQKRSKTKKKEGTNSEMGHTVFACCILIEPTCGRYCMRSILQRIGGNLKLTNDRRKEVRKRIKKEQTVIVRKNIVSVERGNEREHLNKK
jgi:hypothetical protein